MFHTIIIVGNLGRDPEMRYTPSGQAVTTLSVASSRNYQDGSGQQVKETIWFRVTTWGKTAENCNQYLHKGQKVLVEGRLVPDLNTGGPRIWNRQDGTPGASFEVSAQTVRFLSSRGEGDMESTYSPGSTSASSSSSSNDDDIPF
jgi:single-strand DNA-binding protein